MPDGYADPSIPQEDQIHALSDLLRERFAIRQLEATELAGAERRRANRNAKALVELSKYVRQLPPEDLSLRWLADEPIIDGQLDLAEHTFEVLDTLWADRTSNAGVLPTKPQLQRMLARLGTAQTRDHEQQQDDAS